MDLSALPDINTLVTVATPTISVLVMFGKLRTNVTELIQAVHEIQKTIAVLPMLAFRADQVERRIDGMEGRVISLESRISASEKDRENIHAQIDRWGK